MSPPVKITRRMPIHEREAGFTLIGVIGLLGVFSIFAAVLAPNLITHSDRGATDMEVKNLKAVAHGTEAYLRSILAWPALLTDLSPEYVPHGDTQITQNERGFPRYYAVHPNTSGFSNAAGLAQSSLTDARFMTISNLDQDAAPTITNAATFEAWWTTDESATPGLHIARGNIAELFQKLTLKAGNAGGSYQIDNVNTNAGVGTLANHIMYHLKGTIIGLDNANTYVTPEITFALAANAEYRYCSTGWQMGADTTCGGTVRDEFTAISYAGNDGTQNWTNDWQELGEADGPSGGKVKIASSGKCAAGNCILIRGDSINVLGLSRQTDLTAATSATLTFSYRRDFFGGGGGSITLAVSGNGGTNWTSLQTYNLDGTDTSQVLQTFDITGDIASNTQIRFLRSGNSVNAAMAIDNIQIEGN